MREHGIAIRIVDSTRTLNMFLLILTFLLGIIYLFTVNSLSTKGYDIKKLQQSIAELEIEQKNLQVQTYELQSINRIQTEATKLNFVPAVNVTYIKDADYALK